MNTPTYNDRQRINFLDAWNGWTDEVRAAIDFAIERYRSKPHYDARCIDCGTALVQCDCRAGCPGGKCPVCQ